jgi:hypothetical protein
MLDTHMQSLLDISVPNNLLHRHPNSALRDIEHDSSLPVVVLIRQTLLLRRIAHDIDNITDLVRFQLHVRLVAGMCVRMCSI